KPCRVTSDVCSRTAKSCGPGAPGLALNLAGDPRGDGDYKVTDTGESTSISVNTIAQGRPGRSGRACGELLLCFFHCTRGCGCGQHPVFPAPSASRDNDVASLGRFLRRGKVNICHLFEAPIAKEARRPGQASDSERRSGTHTPRTSLCEGRRPL